MKARSFFTEFIGVCIVGILVGSGIYVSTRPAPALAIEVVSLDRYRTDIAQGWWNLPRPADGPLRIPAGTPPVPIPNPNGSFSFQDWERFLLADTNQHRNAVRLLGRPNIVEHLPSGDIALRWLTPKFDDYPVQGGQHATASAMLLITPPSRFAWSYTAHFPASTVPATPPRQLNESRTTKTL